MGKFNILLDLILKSKKKKKTKMNGCSTEQRGSRYLVSHYAGCFCYSSFNELNFGKNRAHQKD